MKTHAREPREWRHEDCFSLAGFPVADALRGETLDFASLLSEKGSEWYVNGCMQAKREIFTKETGSIRSGNVPEENDHIVLSS